MFVSLLTPKALELALGRVKGALLRYDERRERHSALEMIRIPALLCRVYCIDVRKLDTIPL